MLCLIMVIKIHFNKYAGWLPLAIMLVACLTSMAQVGVDTVKYPQLKSYIQKQATQNSATKSNYYVGVWNGSLTKSVLLIRPLGKQTGIVALSSNYSLKKSELNTLSLYPANNSWKYSPNALAVLSSKEQQDLQLVVAGLQLTDVLGFLQSQKNELRIVRVDSSSHSVVIACKGSQWLEKIAQSFIDIALVANPDASIIGYDRSFHGINAVDYTLAGANGKNIVVGIKEQQVESSDLDLYKRVLPSALAANNITQHATVVASIIGGAGNSFYDGRGIAHASTFFPSSFANLFADDLQVLEANKVSVQNHSYGTALQPFYGVEALSYDAQTWRNKNLLHVFSAGNAGLSAASTGQYAGITGFGNITGNFKAAKNIVTVGAITNKENIPAESSAGPLFDGRLAPQLIALGPSGTSDAAAIVSGTAAVMQQVYADSHSGMLPASSLIKATLYNTAEDVYLPGIDFKTGYGLLNTIDAVNAITKQQFIEGTVNKNEIFTTNFSVVANTAKIKFTLAWTDTTAIVNTNSALENDLDFELVNVDNYTRYLPWVLNGFAHADSLQQKAKPGVDSLNTAEQISLEMPPAGNYQLRVFANKIKTQSLPFHIAMKSDMLHTFQFISPQHPSDINRFNSQNLSVRWQCFVADTNSTGKLSIRFNEGGQWQILDPNIKLIGKKFEWPILDTTAVVAFRMETAFGTFFTNEIAIANLTISNYLFNCADSIGIAWNKHPMANAYKIFALTDSAFLKHAYTTTDTFAVVKKSDYPSGIFAVEPMLANQLPAARSAAINVNFSGVKCYYQSFYYTLLNGNDARLIFKLSTIRNVDSIYFEQVEATGQLIQVAGRTRPFQNTFVYDQEVKSLQAGNSYFRVCILMANGQKHYTEIISIRTSGRKAILFYPNPVSRNGMVAFSLQQGISYGSRLQIFDTSGRLLKQYTSLPNRFDFSRLPAGVLIYRLLTEDGKQIETGKLVVTY
jgi:hypothetical protein